MAAIVVCPKCQCQLQVAVSFASGPVSSAASTSDIGQLLEQSEARELNQFESEFISSLRTRYDQYGDRTKVSDKQMGVLQKIARGEGRRQ